MTHRLSCFDTDDVKCERADIDIKPTVRKECRLCGDTVAHQMLIAHFRKKHVGKKPFACSQCSGKRFELLLFEPDLCQIRNISPI
jgi:hypothetical protein